MRSASLTRRALGTVLLAELLCAFAFSGTALLHERQSRLHAFDVSLQGRSDSLLGAVQDAEDPDDNVAIDPAELSLPVADVYAVYNQGGRLLGASAHAPAVLIARDASGFSNRRWEGRNYRVLQREALRIIDREEYGAKGLRRPVTIVYAARTGHIWHEIFEAAEFYMVVSVILLFVTTGLLLLLLRRVLQPLDGLAVAAGGISASALQFAASPEALQLRELAPLATALSAAMDRLRAAFARQHRFLGDATHELKTAVAVVRSTVQLLTLRPRSAEEYQAGLQRVLDDNSRVEELVSRMLLLAQMEEPAAAGAAVTDLAQSAATVLRRVQSFAEAQGVLLQMAACAPVPVRLAPERAEVLLSNLVVNAVQHSAPGETVCVALEREHGTHAVFTITDHGTGIAPEALPHVFERFFREDRSRSRATGGAGLGLAICHAIVEAAHGSIAMQSTPGQGTEVRVIFSLA